MRGRATLSDVLAMATIIRLVHSTARIAQRRRYTSGGTPSRTSAVRSPVGRAEVVVVMVVGPCLVDVPSRSCLHSKVASLPDVNCDT